MAEDIDPADVGAAPGVDVERNAGRRLRPVDVRDGVDVGEGIAVHAQAFADVLDRGLQLRAREAVAGFELYQAAHFRLRNHQVAQDVDRGDRVARAFDDVDRDAD